MVVSNTISLRRNTILLKLLIFLSFIYSIFAQTFKMNDKYKEYFHVNLRKLYNENFDKIKSQLKENNTYTKDEDIDNTIEFNIFNLPTNITLSMIYPLYPKIYPFLNCEILTRREELTKNYEKSEYNIIQRRINRLFTFFMYDKSLKDKFINLLFRNSTSISGVSSGTSNETKLNNDEITTEILNDTLKVAPLFVSLSVASMISWIILCSCNCYDYCPIICKKNDSEPYSKNTKYISVILFLFTTLNMIGTIVLVNHVYS